MVHSVENGTDRHAYIQDISTIFLQNLGFDENPTNWDPIVGKSGRQVNQSLSLTLINSTVELIHSLSNLHVNDELPS